MPNPPDTTRRMPEADQVFEDKDGSILYERCFVGGHYLEAEIEQGGPFEWMHVPYGCGAEHWESDTIDDLRAIEIVEKYQLGGPQSGSQ